MFEDFLEQFNKDKNLDPNTQENINKIYEESYQKMKELLIKRLPDSFKSDKNTQVKLEIMAKDTLYQVLVLFIMNYNLQISKINSLNSKVNELQTKIIKIESLLNNKQG